jgi:hypothetical protein
MSISTSDMSLKDTSYLVGTDSLTLDSRPFNFYSGYGANSFRVGWLIRDPASITINTGIFTSQSLIC